MKSLTNIAYNILLSETPDYVRVPGSKRILGHDDNDTYTFGYRLEFESKNFMMMAKGSHWELFKGLERIPYSGRLWRNSKIITFWSYPKTMDILKQIIKDLNFYALENKMQLTITSAWQIEEIVERISGKIVTPFKRDNYPRDILSTEQQSRSGPGWGANPLVRYAEYKTIIVPINDYLKPIQPEW